MVRTALSWIVGGVSSILMVSAQAHHSFRAQYDSEKPIEVTGYVTKIDWMNPHVYFYIDVVNAQGKTESWAFEMGPPHMLEQRGWKRNSMAIGDELEVSGTRAPRASAGECPGAAGAVPARRVGPDQSGT